MIVGVMIMAVLGIVTAFLQGRLSPKEEGEIRYSEVKVPEGTVYPGKLCAVSYEYNAGSMERRTGFFIEVTPDEVVSCGYYAPLRRDMVEKSHKSISAKRWEQLEKIILILYPGMEQFEPAEDPDPMPEDVHVLDGGYKNALTLTWSTEDGTFSSLYIQSSDRRYMTLYTLLREIAQPIGRKIPWYEGP